MSPPIRDGSGSSIGSIRLGDGSEINEVRTGAGDVLFPPLPVAASDLVAWYPFRSGTGEDITAGDSNFGDTTDYSATANGATFKPSGGVTDIQTGANSGSFEFDGTDDTLELGTVADSDQNLTMMAWVSPDKSTDVQRVMTKNDGTGGFPSGAFVFQLEGSTVRISLDTGSERSIITTSTTVSINTFSHIAARLDFSFGDITLFINGQPQVSGATQQPQPFSSQPWGVAGDVVPDSGDRLLDGIVDDTRIYTAALSDSQINQIYLNTKP